MTEWSLTTKIYEPGSEYPMNNVINQPRKYCHSIYRWSGFVCRGTWSEDLAYALHYASMGLTGLMGIQVDPYYGQNRLDERLYIKVANFGNEQVVLSKGDTVFNIEFSINRRG